MFHKTISCLVLFLFIVSCTTTSPKNETRYLASIDSNDEFIGLMSNIESSVEEGTSSTLECSEKLTFYYESLYYLKSEMIRPEDFDNDELTELIQSSFKARLGIKEKMKALKVKSFSSKKCLKSIKDMVRALRYVEDYFIEVLYSRDQNLSKTEFVTFEGSGAHFLINPKFEDSFSDWSDLKSGDVILSRGNAFSSAAIARIGDVDTQFSHLTLVYRDKTDKLHTIEAHIEIGNVVAPFDAHIGEKNARSVLFRHKDPKLAHRAAQIMYEMVEKQQKTGKNIEYDFAMDYNDSKRIFCSEVIYLGYKLAGEERNQKIDIPMYKTKFNSGLIPFLNVLGIKINESNVNKFDTFGPGDIQFDSRFQMIAEWRNPKNMKDSRFKDMILTKVFEWMEKEDYKLRPSTGTSISSYTAWVLRRSPIPLPFLSKKLKQKFPLNMSVDQLKLFQALDEVGEKFYKKLEETQSNEGYSLAPIDMFEALDEFKENDEKRFKAYKSFRKKYRQSRHRRTKSSRSNHRKMIDNKPVFHLKFHP